MKNWGISNLGEMFELGFFGFVAVNEIAGFLSLGRIHEEF